MAEELVMNVKSNVKSVTKETQDWAKSLEEVNEQIEIQEKVILDLDKDLIKLKAQQDKIPKGAWVAGMGKLNDDIRETSTELKLEKNALQELKLTQEEASEEVKKFTDAQKEQEKAAQDSIESFTFMGVSLGGVKTAMSKVIPTAKAMFGTIKAGLISTGIGAFIIAIGSLVSYFTNTQKGADKLSKAFAGIGTVVSVITDRFSKLGELIVGVFNDPKKAIKDLWEALKKNLVNRITGVIDAFGALGKVIKSTLSLDWDGATEGAKDYAQALVQVTTGLDTEQQAAFANGIKNITDEMVKEKAIIDALMDSTFALRDSQRDLNVETAQRRADIEALKLVAEDVTKSEEERLAAAKKAFKIETELLDRRVANAEEAVRIQKEQNALNQSMDADLDALAEKEIALADIKAESTTKQIELNNKINAIELQTATAQAAAEKARLDGLAKEKEALQAIMDLETERLNKQITDVAEALDAHYASQRTAEANEILAAQDKWDKLIAGEEEGSVMLADLQRARGEELAAIEKKYAEEGGNAKVQKAKEVTKDLKALLAQEVKWSEMTGDEKIDVAGEVAGKLKDFAGEQTEVGKAAAIVQATIDTYKSAQASYASLAGIPVVGPVLGGIAAAAAVASGIKNVQAISSAGGGGGGGGNLTAPSTPTEQAPAPQMMSGEFDLTGGVAPEPVKAFVVTDEMTNSQNQLANIRRRATI